MTNRDETAFQPEGPTDEGAVEEPTPESGDAPVVESADGPVADSDDAEPVAPDDGLTPRERRQERLRLIRQRRRERRIWIAMFVGGLGVLVVFMYFFWPVMAGRLDAVKQVDEAQSLLDQAKPTVVGIDKIVTLQLSPSANAGVPDTAAQVLVARRGLKQALALLGDAMPHLADDEQKRAQAIQSVATARLDMVDRAPAILSASVKAVKSKSLADQGWKLAQSASAAETLAVSAYRSGKASSIASASIVLQRAGGQLGDAGALYSQAATAFPGAGFERHAAAASLRAQAVKALSQVLGTWLGGDIPGAAAEFTLYGKAATKASAAAAKLQPAPGVPGQEFRRIAGRAADAYAKAKKQALDADKALGTL